MAGWLGDEAEIANPGAARIIPMKDAALGYNMKHGAMDHNNSMQLLQHQNPKACK